jgi:hypothetical protein
MRVCAHLVVSARRHLPSLAFACTRMQANIVLPELTWLIRATRWCRVNSCNTMVGVKRGAQKSASFCYELGNGSVRVRASEIVWMRDSVCACARLLQHARSITLAPAQEGMQQAWRQSQRKPARPGQAEPAAVAQAAQGTRLVEEKAEGGKSAGRGIEGVRSPGEVGRVCSACGVAGTELKACAECHSTWCSVPACSLAREMLDRTPTRKRPPTAPPSLQSRTLELATMLKDAGQMSPPSLTPALGLLLQQLAGTAAKSASEFTGRAGTNTSAKT